jgi:hypothetical protein
VSTSLVDDEGVDLVVHRRGSTATSGFNPTVFVAFVRSQTVIARGNLDMLFVSIDVVHGIVMKAWLVPSKAYAHTLGGPNSRGRYRFSASMKDDTNDRWRPYRLEPRRNCLLRY